ncbi:MAG: hypothetical protein QOI07_932 [Verrucomicrobiota bacterium]|jgi:hypothetical protein
MAVASQSGVPCRFTAGDAVLFTVSDTDHPATFWFMDLVLSRQGVHLATVRATTGSNGKDYQVSISSTVSALTPGFCKYDLVFTDNADSTQRETGGSGWITVLPNPTGTLAQSANQIALAACNEAIQKLVSRSHSTVNFNGQSFTSMNIGELLKARDRLQLLVNNELAGLGLSRGGGFRIIRNRFR